MSSSSPASKPEGEQPSFLQKKSGCFSVFTVVTLIGALLYREMNISPQNLGVFAGEKKSLSHVAGQLAQTQQHMSGIEALLALLQEKAIKSAQTSLPDVDWSGSIVTISGGASSEYVPPSFRYSSMGQYKIDWSEQIVNPKTHQPLPDTTQAIMTVSAPGGSVYTMDLADQ